MKENINHFSLADLKRHMGLDDGLNEDVFIHNFKVEEDSKKVPHVPGRADAIGITICHEGEIPAFTLKQQIQADEVNAGGSADIHIHPSGRWLYTSHRLKNDGIAAFHVFPDGTLKKIGYTITGRHPRNFMITDDGEYLLVACRDDKCIQVLQILPTGCLAHTSTTLRFDEDKPVCVTVRP